MSACLLFNQIAIWSEMQGINKHITKLPKKSMYWTCMDKVADRRRLYWQCKRRWNPLSPNIKWRGYWKLVTTKKPVTRQLRAYKVMLNGLEEKMEVSVKVKSDATAVAAYELTLGWRVYVTNAPKRKWHNGLCIDISRRVYHRTWF